MTEEVLQKHIQAYVFDSKITLSQSFERCKVLRDTIEILMDDLKDDMSDELDGEE